MHDLLYRLVWPVLRRLDPEQVHRLAVVSLERGLMRPTAAADDPILATRVFGLDFTNPIGLGAGFDKHAEVIDAMFGFGFGFVEAGTVTPKPQPGNTGQRLFRLDEDEAVINRFGFNSEGLEPFVARLKARRAKGARGGIVGANIGKNRTTEDAAADYETCIAAVAPLVDYVVVNVSSPNTPGLRGLQARAPIEALVGRVLAARDAAGAAGAGAAGDEPAPKRPPILLKVGPDLDEDQVRDIAEVVLDTGVDGLIVGNTTVTRPPTLRSRWRDAEGGLSGRPLMGLATEAAGLAGHRRGGLHHHRGQPRSRRDRRRLGPGPRLGAGARPREPSPARRGGQVPAHRAGRLTAPAWTRRPVGRET